MKSVINKSRSSKKQFSVISIIIPFYQRNNELISLLKSLEIVEYPLKYLEIIIVQDGSKVDSDVLIIIKNSKLKIKLISNDTNLGPGYSRNHGSDYAEGKYLWFLDTDAYITNPLVLSNMLSFLEESSKCLAVGGITETISNEDRILIPVQLPAYHFLLESIKISDNYVDIVPFLSTTSFFLRKKDFFETGKFDPSLRMYEDNEFGIRLQRRYDGYLIQSGKTMIHHSFSPTGRNDGFFSYFRDSSDYMKIKFESRNKILRRHSRWRLLVLIFLEVYSISVYYIGYKQNKYHLSRFNFSKNKHPFIMRIQGLYYLIMSVITGFILFFKSSNIK